jgi:hypothetical protein
LTAVGLSPAADPVPAATPPVLAQPKEHTPTERVVVIPSRPLSPYGPAIAGQHPAVPPPPVVIAQDGPSPREIGPSTLPMPIETPLPAEWANPWSDFPPVQVLPRLGFFLVPGSGPGYYSFLDVIQGNYRVKPPAFPYPPFALQPPSGFDADYRYLDKPDNTQHDFFDVVKRMHPTPDTMVTIGGQSSVRYMNEVDARLGPVNNNYTLYRNRAWVDVWYTNSFRVYGEFISALIDGNELPPLPIDENRADIQNLFVELEVCRIAGSPAFVRVGRQEMLFGSQRLVSTLDWANTRRTFEGVRGFWRSESFDVDAFWTYPVPVDPNNHDEANTKIQFYGVWTSARPVKGTFLDLYYLGLTDNTIVADRYLPGAFAPRGTQEIHTLGARFAGNHESLLWDFEVMAQTGQYVRRDHHANAYTASVGWEFREHSWRPQFWVGYDYASGTDQPFSNDHTTFHQLFPFGHYYFGYLDLVGRQNIEDVSFQAVVYPDNWITVVAQCHHFRLAEANDFLYNAGGVPTRRSLTGLDSRDVGNEIDLFVNFHLTPHADVLIGYSKLYAGEFIRRTGPDVSPELFYVMCNYRW